MLSSPWIYFASQFQYLRPSLLSITLTQPYWILCIWSSLNGSRIWPLRSTQTPFIQIPHFHQDCQRNKWTLTHICIFPLYQMKLSLVLLPYYMLGKVYSIFQCSKLVLIRMKFSVELILNKPLNKTIKTLHITAHIQPR